MKAGTAAGGPASESSLRGLPWSYGDSDLSPKKRDCKFVGRRRRRREREREREREMLSPRVRRRLRRGPRTTRRRGASLRRTRRRKWKSIGIDWAALLSLAPLSLARRETGNLRDS